MIAALLLFLLLAMGASALFSSAETGFYVFSRVRLRIGLEEGEHGARRLHRLVRQPALLLTILLIGNNLALELVTLCNEVLLERYTDMTAQARATLGTLVATPLVFVLCEALPKSASLAQPYVLLMRSSVLLQIAFRVLWPLGVLINWLTHGIQRAIGEAQEPAAAGSSLRERSLEPELHAGVEEGFLSHSESSLATSVLRLATLRARDVAVPASRLPILALPASVERWTQVLLGSIESRALVRDEQGQVVGLVHAVDLALAVADGREDLEAVVRPLPRVGPNLPLSSLLEKLSARGVPLAVVETRPGAPLAVVRTRDVVEEVVGRDPGT